MSNLYVARSERRAGSRRLAASLLWITIAWNLAEGGVAVISGFAAASVALIGFGLDSFIEVTAAGILLWRMGLPEHDDSAEWRESTAHWIVGFTFILLAAYIGAQTLYTFVAGDEPDSSSVGLVLASVSLLVMPSLALETLERPTCRLSRADRRVHRDAPLFLPRACSFRGACGERYRGLVVGGRSGGLGDDPLDHQGGPGGAARARPRRRSCLMDRGRLPRIATHTSNRPLRGSRPGTETADTFDFE